MAHHAQIIVRLCKFDLAASGHSCHSCWRGGGEKDRPTLQTSQGSKLCLGGAYSSELIDEKGRDILACI